MRSWTICWGPPRPERHSRWRLPSTLVFLAVGLGCTTHLTPKPFELEDAWPRIATAGDVAVRAGAAPSGRHVLKVSGSSFTVDYAEFTASLVARTRQALNEQGAELSEAAQRSIEVEVVYVSILPGAGRFHCVIDFTLRTGDGYVRGLQARANSWRTDNACNAALSESALVALRDGHVASYLARP